MGPEKETTMHLIKTIGREKAAGKLNDVYANIEAMFGMVPAIFQSQSLMPGMLEAVIMFIRELMFKRHRLTRFQKELIATYVSKINLCEY